MRTNAERLALLTHPGDSTKKLLNAEELAGFLNVKISTIRAWTSQRAIPSIRLGRRCVRYQLYAVLDAIGESIEVRRSER